ncbi:MAG: cytochrome c-type biogenesis protein CcmH [Caulobacteraceae bacterium]|nr:cytochrome c-type biogenesis protein CcmH [Caulobacter sp.]
MRRLALALILGLALAGTARAVEPGEMLKDPALEARARVVSAELRCLVCQNESIDESHAALAHDIRVLVRQRIEAGDTNAQVRAYLVARYGQFILLKPPVERQTLLLWGTPVLVLVLGGLAIAAAARRRPARDPARPLSEAERSRLDELVGGGSHRAT